MQLVDGASTNDNIEARGIDHNEVCVVEHRRKGRALRLRIVGRPSSFHVPDRVDRMVCDGVSVVCSWDIPKVLTKLLRKLSRDCVVFALGVEQHHTNMSYI